MKSAVKCQTHNPVYQSRSFTVPTTCETRDTSRHPSRMKQIPSPRTQRQKLFFFLPLHLRAIDALAKRSPPRFWTASQRRCSHIFFIFRTRTPSATARATLRRFAVALTLDKVVRCKTTTHQWGRWGRWLAAALMTAIVNDFGKQILTTAGHLRYHLFRRSIISRATCCRHRVRRWGWKTWRRKGRPVIGMRRVRVRLRLVEAVSVLIFPMYTQAPACKYVGDRGQAGTTLSLTDRMYMRGAREIRRLVGDMTGQGMLLMSAGETLVERS